MSKQRRWESSSKCSVCGAPLHGRHTKYCNSEECLAEKRRRIYLDRKRRIALSRLCPVCGKTIPNRFDLFCSIECEVKSESISGEELRFIRRHRHDIVALAKSALQIAESEKRIEEIEDRLRRKYRSRHPNTLPYFTMLKEFGFIEYKQLSMELMLAGMLSGGTYLDVAYDMSRYRKLFDYGIELEMIE